MEYCPHCMHSASGKFCQYCGKPLSWTPGEQQLPAGTMLDGSGLHRYLTGAAIGQGGFGITYIAVEPDSGRRVAVKECFPVQCAERAGDSVAVVPKPGCSQQLQGALTSFLDEARLLARQTELKTVVQVVDFFSTNGTAYLVMEFLDGVTLHQKMQENGRLPAQKLLSMLRPLMADIGALHSSGIIHRDISPDNIMWMPDDSLKLIDFGCARSIEDGRSMSILLKHGFAPVEQYQTRGQGPWTDIYSLCATIYYCITGSLPASAVDRLEGSELTLPTQLGAELSRKQEEALLWGLEVQPTKRPQSMELLMSQLYDRADESKRTDDVPLGPRKTGKKPPLKAIGIAAAALVVILTIVIGLSSGDDEPGGSAAWTEPTSGTEASEAPYVTQMPDEGQVGQQVTGMTEDGLKYVSLDGSVAVTGYNGLISGHITIPEEIDGMPVTMINDGAFSDQTAMSSIIIPEYVSQIGANAFSGCTRLESIYLFRNAEAAPGAFSGCDSLRAIVLVNDFSFSREDWALGSEVCVFDYGMDTGFGELVIVDVTSDGVVYGVTEDDNAVVMDIPAGLEVVEIQESLGDYPVMWMYEGALDRAEDGVVVYLASQMAFPFDLFNKAIWQLKSDFSAGDFCVCWYLSCWLANDINVKRDQTMDFYDLEHLGPDYDLAKATLQRANELSLLFDHDRPYAGDFDTILEEYGVDYRSATELIKKLNDYDEVDAYVSGKCVELFYGEDEDTGELFNNIAVGIFWSGLEDEPIYLCCIGTEN